MENPIMDIENETFSAALPRSEVIARLNDTLRKTGTGGTIMLTQGVMALKDFDRAVLTTALANYDAFDPDNDPHGERDFGDLTVFGTDLLWKIDYYDSDQKFGSDGPADAGMTSRILTIMLVTEY
jgi:Protein of unknown function (DUF3768)